MSEHPTPAAPETSVNLALDAQQIHPRADLKDAVFWIVLGIAILIGSITMDRLERQNINPYTVPGLLPGLLGLLMILLGAILALRSVRHGALDKRSPPKSAHERAQGRRIWIVTGLCTLYAVVLVGRGLPFWLASTLFVSGSILLLQRISLDPQEQKLSAKTWAKALVIGVGTGVITQLVFQELFLVYLP
jgi:uncharacterized membrane protein